jgi:hypothetical protein
VGLPRYVSADKTAWVTGGFLGKVAQPHLWPRIVIALTYNTLVYTPLTTNFSGWYAGNGLAMVVFTSRWPPSAFTPRKRGDRSFKVVCEPLEEWDGHSDRIGYW